MKGSFIGILLITVGILGFVLGYSMAPTDVESLRHGAVQQAASGGGESGGYGASDSGSGGYGASGGGGGGGYGAPAASGGYGAPAPKAGGYGQ